MRVPQPWIEDLLQRAPGLLEVDDVALAKFDPQRKRVYFTRASRPGLWSSDAGLQNVALVEATRPYPMNYRNWAIGDGEVYLVNEAVLSAALVNVSSDACLPGLKGRISNR